jgi:GalNAc-alpha-(1->4)-GalNAc-alpha-(1->3)-diNAcBac-PP-undecaprenol alpha-1,4-N-acetyl-D-galactosaminyltransferase
MKIALITTSVSEGGAQRVAATLANSWARAGHIVQVITFEPPGTSPEFQLRTDITLVQLDLMKQSETLLQAVWKNFHRTRVLRKHLRNDSPDVVIALITGPNILAVLAGLGRPWPTVISERVHPAYQPIEKSWALLRRWVYRYADAIVVQSVDIAAWFKATFQLETVILPNPIDLERFRAPDLVVPKTRYRAMAAGRLDPQKGFDILIKAFAHVAPRHPDWDLVIYGRGNERASLERLIATHGMQDRIELAGTNYDIAKAYADADLLVHPARYEGYPNVIQEALAAGRPVVATDCPGATRDLLANGRYGVLVKADNVESLQVALAAIFADPLLRASLAKTAPAAVNAYEADKVAVRWIALFRELLNRESKKH